MTHTKT